MCAALAACKGARARIHNVYLPSPEADARRLFALRLCSECTSEKFRSRGPPAVSSPSSDRPQSNSCQVAIKFSPNPKAVGQTIFAHYYGVTVTAGKTYTVTLGGLSSAFPAGITVFCGGSEVAQAAPGDLAASSRTVTVAPTSTGAYVIEVSSGIFVNGVTWANPTGSYTLTVSK